MATKKRTLRKQTKNNKRTRTIRTKKRGLFRRKMLRGGYPQETPIEQVKTKSLLKNKLSYLHKLDSERMNGNASAGILTEIGNLKNEIAVLKLQDEENRKYYNEDNEQHVLHSWQ